MPSAQQMWGLGVLHMVAVAHCSALHMHAEVQQEVAARGLLQQLQQQLQPQTEALQFAREAAPAAEYTGVRTVAQLFEALAGGDCRCWWRRQEGQAACCW